MPSPSRPKITREFRNKMARDAVFVLLGLVAVLLIAVDVLDRKTFFIAALVLIPVAAMTFNILQRRAFAAYSAGKELRE